MTKKLKAFEAPRKLVEGGLHIFSKREFERFFNVSTTAATFFLHHHCRSGLFVRLKNGLFALAAQFPSEEEIANRLYQPSYLSFEYVLARFGVIPEAVYEITSATTKPSREFIVEGKMYTFSTLKKELFFGYQSQKIKGRTILIAMPEKAMIDWLYLVDLKRRPFNDRLDLSKLSKQKLLAHAKHFARGSLTKRLQELL